MGTTSDGYPYPEGTDFVMDGDDAIRALAEAIGAHGFAAAAAGTATVPSIPNGEVKSMTVTLPSGRFTTVPRVTVTPNTGSPNVRAASVSSPSVTSFVLNAYNGSSTTQGLAVFWNAMQLNADPAMAEPTFTARSATNDGSATVTCTTPECENQGVAIVIASTWIDEEGASHDVAIVQCGVCGADISDTMQPIEGS